ncbi:MAG: LamG-like jellyroll fold domain-containing protein [Ignavibacteriales bacterium]
MTKVRTYFSVVFLLLLSPVMFAQVGNYALRLDGVDDYVSIPHNDVFNVSKVTIEMWMLWENTTAADDVDFLIGKSMEELEIHTGGGSGNHALRFIPTTRVYLDTDSDIFQSGIWYHVAFVYDPSISLYKCYINGVEKNLTNRGDNGVNTSIIHSAEPLRIGIRTGNYYSFQGKLDEIRIWNVARSASEISANMNTELDGNESGLIAYYKMSNGSGTLLTDNSINGNQGTLVNGPVWISGEVSLPVELTFFDARVNNHVVLLNWTTATEVNNYGFEIQRSASGSLPSNDSWQDIGFIQGHGNSNHPQEYSFTDDNPPTGKIQYRLKQIDADGSYKCYDAVSVVVDSPMEFKLHQNCPNPFNPSTVISYLIPEGKDVKLTIYDMLGKEISILVNEFQSAGLHSVQLNAANLPSGVYLYTIQAGQFRDSKKLLLLK